MKEDKDMRAFRMNERNVIISSMLNAVATCLGEDGQNPCLTHVTTSSSQEQNSIWWVWQRPGYGTKMQFYKKDRIMLHLSFIFYISKRVILFIKKWYRTPCIQVIWNINMTRIIIIMDRKLVEPWWNNCCFKEIGLDRHFQAPIGL